MARARMGTTRTYRLDAWADLTATLRRYARALTGSADAADDLTQQTLARLLARNPGKAAHLGYAHATMTRAWLDEQRSVRRRLARLGTLIAAATRSSPGEAARRGASSSVDPAAGREDVAAVNRALDSLPPRRRAAMVLKAVEGLSYEQIGTALGCSVATVRGELHEARKAMRSVLGSDVVKDAR